MISARGFCVAVLAVASSAGAQGTLSTQGFGYPPGEFSSRALGTGGGLAQFDPQSSVNPAAVGTSGDPLLFLQYEPEFRRLSSGGHTQKTTTSRFPLVVASVPVSTRGTLAVSVSTLLDRSWQTTTTREETIAGDKATLTETVRSLGAINDVRVAGAWVANDFIQLGIAGHLFTGQNRLFFSQTFPDSLHFVPVNQLSSLDYTGVAVSAGVVIRPSSVVTLAASGRKGGHLDARTGDTVVSSAKIPDRYGAAISFAGIPGATISAQLARDLWSSLNGLGSSDARAVDAWDAGGGIEAAGPKILERTLLIRLGARYRTLPFVALEHEVRELSFAGGFGLQFSRNRAAFDVTVQRASRSPNGSGTLGDVRERAYTLSFGLRVRP
jgi:hypothetical protein